MPNDLIFRNNVPGWMKPSWCLEVITSYFIPASLAIWIRSLASNLAGLNSRWPLQWHEVGRIVSRIGKRAGVAVNSDG